MYVHVCNVNYIIQEYVNGNITFLCYSFIHHSVNITGNWLLVTML